MRRFTSVLIAVVVLSNLTFNVAQANIIDMTPTEFSQGSTPIAQTLNGNNNNSLAGMFKLEIANPPASLPWLIAGEDINAFCVELDQSIGFGSSINFNIVNSATYFNAVTTESVGRLFTSAFESVTDQTDTNEQRIFSSAFQVALWELVYDSGSVNLDNGVYQASATNDADVLARANSFLSNLGSSSSAYDVFVLQNDNLQDLVIVNPKLAQSVSAPATIALFGLALAFFGLRARARKA